MSGRSTVQVRQEGHARWYVEQRVTICRSHGAEPQRRNNWTAVVHDIALEEDGGCQPTRPVMAQHDMGQRWEESVKVMAELEWVRET